MINSYKIKPRPNLYDLSIMEGVLNGGGVSPTAEREAYWQEPASEDMETLMWMEYNPTKPLDEAD